jgi:uncharacterized membrane protein
MHARTDSSLSPSFRLPSPASRLSYLDWLRGLAVLIMIEAHTFDAWTGVADRQRSGYANAMILGGFGAPLFLFLAGIGVALSAASKARRGTTEAAARAVQRRGWQILGLAFLFRLQAYVFGGGGAIESLLKVDILNIMGLSMVGAAALWGTTTTTGSRLATFAAAALATSLVTPIVRSAGWLDWLPDPVEWYLRPAAGRTNFTLLPWAGFVFAGALIGVLIDACRANQWPLIRWAGPAGAALAALSYAASFRPSIYANSSFWTTAPTFFLLRVGILVAGLALAYVWAERLSREGWSPMEEFGRSSLFVYWVHVELVYGIPTAWLRRQLSLEQAALAYAIFTLLMFALVLVKDRIVRAVWPQRALSPLSHR